MYLSNGPIDQGYLKRAALWVATVFAVVILTMSAADAHIAHDTPRCSTSNLDEQSGHDRVERYIRCMAKSFQLNPGEAIAVAECESHLDPQAYNKPYAGVYQHDEKLWPRRARKFGFSGHSPFDPIANIVVTLRAVMGGGWGPWGCA
jgi:hypothetical protein